MCCKGCWDGICQCWATLAAACVAWSTLVFVVIWSLLNEHGNERKGGQALSPPPLHVGGGVSSSSARRDGTKLSLLDGLGDVVHGAASAELAEASSDLGTAITESSRQKNSLQPSIVWFKPDSPEALIHERLYGIRN